MSLNAMRFAISMVLALAPGIAAAADLPPAAAGTAHCSSRLCAAATGIDVYSRCRTPHCSGLARRIRQFW
jgi:hypothetical protein